MKIGDTVKWRSQAGGYSTEKTGEIVLVIPAGAPPFVKLHKNLNYHDFAIMFDGNLPRPEESYLVKVETPGRKPRLYWPRVKKLTLVS